MTKKKRELIEILLDNVKPEDWPENTVYAAQDKETFSYGKWVLMFYSDFEIPHVNVGRNSFAGKRVGREIKLPELCKYWNKTIVHRDEFMKRWNERNQAVDSECLNNPDDGISVSFADAASPLKTQIGGDHYTKLAIQPMQYSMNNRLDPLQHTIIKYVTRFRDKTGIEDLEKAKHCIDMLIEFEKESK
jgi:hypothetical protein